MSSVGRQISQRPTNSLSNYLSYACGIDTLKAQFSGYNPTYVDSFILFDTEADFIGAINALYEYLFGNSATYQMAYGFAVMDLGKKLYIGLKGGESKLLTFTYIKPTFGQLSDLNTGVYSLIEIGRLTQTAKTALTILSAVHTLARSG